MTSKSSELSYNEYNLSRFCDVIEQLCNYLIEVYPDETDFKKFRTSYYAIKQVNAKAIINSYISFVYPYKHQIMKENEDFFLNNDYKNEIGGDQKSIMKAMNLKNIWKKEETTDEVKGTIWKYFKVLTTLVEKTVSFN